MKEIIYHVTASTPGRVITIAVDEVLTKDNILGIINKTTGKVLYTPLKYPLLTFGLSAGTLTLTLDSSIPSISVGDNLLIKVYSDDDGYAKEAAATANKQTILDKIGDCIIPDFELPCLPFEKYSGFSGLENDGDFYFGDFMPQVGSMVSQLFVGAIIKVTGDNATEVEFAGFPADSRMSVAHTVSEEEAGYEQGLYGSLQEGDPVYGVTSEITWQKDHYYRVTGFHDIYDMTNHEVIEGLVITYEEVDPATITDMGKKIAKKVDEVKELIEEGSSGDAAEQVKDFFGIVKDGDTVKVVTEDGGEEVVEPVGLMDEDDVYDYLEDIAVLMGGITAEQAASITAATRAIIHGGSGSGEGGEGGSGSGSGE